MSQRPVQTAVRSHLHSGEHVAALDGIRGIAIIAVLFFHFGQYGHGLPPPTAFVDRLVNEVVRVGWAGVDLFFVLSGFLITGILYDSKGGRHYFRNFYARRCLRIFPLYYLTLFLFLVCLPRLEPTNEAVQYLKQNSIWFWTYTSNVLVAHRGWHVIGLLDHLWSLAVEEQFYLVWPVVILICTRRTLWSVCACAIVGALAVRIGLYLSGREVAAYVLSPARVDALAVGAVAAVLARGPGLARFAPTARGVMGVSALALGLIAFVRGGLDEQDAFVATVGHTLLAGFFGSFLVIALTSEPRAVLQKVLSSPILTFFGKYSYALYVVHSPLMFVRPPSLSLEVVPTVAGSHLPALVLYVASATLLSLGLAIASWHICEKQFLKLKRFFPYQTGDGMDRYASAIDPRRARMAYAEVNGGMSASTFRGRDDV